MYAACFLVFAVCCLTYAVVFAVCCWQAAKNVAAGASF